MRKCSLGNVIKIVQGIKGHIQSYFVNENISHEKCKVMCATILINFMARDRIPLCKLYFPFLANERS